jgi:hypothetical protein
MVLAPVDRPGLALAPAFALLDVLARVAWVPDRPARPAVAPYFHRLPRGLSDLYLPRLLADTTRFVLEEAVPAAPDTGVRIEGNDLLVTLRADDPDHLADALAWLAGSDRLAGHPVASPRLPAGLRFTSGRVVFAQPGLPRALAVRYGLRYADRIDPRSPAWTGNQPDAGDTVTFRAAATTAQRGDYFDEGSVLHLSHGLVDLSGAAADDGFTERVRCLFRAGPAGGGTPTAPPHQRIDGPGLSAMDVPDGAVQPKHQSAILVPAAGHLAGVRLTAATRRQNFLVPPRRRRAFPLIELA